MANRLIGISGLPRSGKDMVAEVLMHHGYYGVSLGDIVRDYARQRHADKPDPISVTNLTETSNWLRAERGADFALNMALERYETAQATAAYQGLVVYSVRAPIEVDFILGHGGDIIWIDTQDELRFERDKNARREGEAEVSIEQFLAAEAKQWQPQPDIDKAVQMDVAYVKAHATITIENNGNDLNAFEAEVIRRLGLKG